MSMAHYALLDGDIVSQVIVGVGEGVDGVNWERYYGEQRGQRCLRCSYNTHGGVHRLGGTPYRMNYPGPGYRYDDRLDGFIPPCPGDGWTLDETTGTWKPPITPEKTS